MADQEARAPNAETNRSSRPFPQSADHFPMQSTSENPTAVSQSERNEDRPLIGGSINRAETENTQHNSYPSAPYTSAILASERIQSRPTIEFTNPLAYQSELALCHPPPSYDELFAPKNIIQSQTTPNGTFTNARTVTSPRAIVVPITACVPGNRIITHPPAHLVGVRSGSTNVGVETYLKILLLLMAALGIFLVYVRTR